MSRYNKDLGDFGEMAAEHYLIERGFEILERNFSVRGGEIDIVAMDGDVLVFVEVKTRSSKRFGLPSEAVNAQKILHLRQAAEVYIENHPPKSDVRFDVVEVEAAIADGVPQLFGINHIEDALPA